MASGYTVGTAVVSVEAEVDKGSASKITKGFESAGTSAGDLFNGKFGSALKKLGGFIGSLKIGQKIGDTIADSIKAYANYEQLVGGVETLFKDSADMVQRYAAQAYKNQGMSANAYMETVTGFSASLLQSLGGDTEKAAKIADMAITDMSDNANKMGTSMESIQYAYQGFAKQNYTMLDNLKLGYGGTRSEMERLLKDAEKLTGIHYDISNLSDVYEAIHAIQTEMGITGTTAQEAATTLSGAWNSAKAAFDNWLVTLADPNGDVAGNTQQMMDSMTHVVEMAAPVLGNALGNLIGQLPGIIIEHIPDIVEAIVMMVLKMGESFLNGLDNLFTDFGNWVAKLVNGTDEAGDQMADATGEGVDKSIAEIDRLPEEAHNRLDNIDVSSGGRSLGDSFAEGILASIGKVRDASIMMVQAAHDPIPNSPAKIGPFSGKGWTLYSGESVAEAFAEGFTRKIGQVQSQINAGMVGIAATINQGDAYNISMSVTADSTTTLDNLVAQARRARALNGGY